MAINTMGTISRTSPTSTLSTPSTVSDVKARSWYVIHCKSHHEDKVNALLRSRSIETFYPTMPVNPVNPRAARVQPYFPGYLFIHVDLAETGISTLQWLPGAIGLVQFDEQPAPVPDPVIFRLRQQISRMRTSASYRHHLEAGDRIRRERGMFAGYDAIFDARLDGETRVRVLLNLLGRTTCAAGDPKRTESPDHPHNTGAIRKRAS